MVVVAAAGVESAGNGFVRCGANITRNPSCRSIADRKVQIGPLTFPTVGGPFSFSLTPLREAIFG